MGITIHYWLKFRGSEKKVLELLPKIGEIAGGIHFQEYDKLWKVDYATDCNTPDQWTPLNEGKVIDESYRWAKIQYEPLLRPMLAGDDTPSARLEKERRILKLKQQSGKYSGWVQHLWYGDDCEATNIGLVHNGNSRSWQGSAFTKTQWAKNFMQAHLSVCLLLKELEKLGILEKVTDEAGLWKNWNSSRLADIDQFPPESRQKIKRLLLRLRY
jgi:hypothetical protein